MRTGNGTVRAVDDQPARGRLGGGGHDLDLRRPIYRQTAAYGHFGRPDLDLPWEALDRVEELKHAAANEIVTA